MDCERVKAEEYWRTHREGGGTESDLRRFVQGWCARSALDAAPEPAQAMDAEPWAWGAVDPDKPTERAVALTREQAERYAHNLAFSGKAGVGFKYRSGPVVPLYAHPAPPAPDAAQLERALRACAETALALVNHRDEYRIEAAIAAGVAALKGGGAA